MNAAMADNLDGCPLDSLCYGVRYCGRWRYHGVGGYRIDMWGGHGDLSGMPETATRAKVQELAGHFENVDIRPRGALLAGA